MTLNIRAFAKAYNWLMAGGDDQYTFNYNWWTLSGLGDEEREAFGMGRKCDSVACIGGYIEQVIFVPQTGAVQLETPEGYAFLGLTTTQFNDLFFADVTEDFDPYRATGPEVAEWMLDKLEGWYPGSSAQIFELATEYASRTKVNGDVVERGLEVA